MANNNYGSGLVTTKGIFLVCLNIPRVMINLYYTKYINKDSNVFPYFKNNFLC